MLPTLMTTPESVLAGDKSFAGRGRANARPQAYDQNHREAYQLGQRAGETLRRERNAYGMTAAPGHTACGREWSRRYVATDLTRQDEAAFIAGCLDGAVEQGAR